ncbi:MraY family glycosyltransferase [Parafrankia elaeagni]|uniref:MraY family glycosyltransferase n=1 Tax=Parafrankia elaeagni TaxID=222534 RepID=UPI000363DCCC|nr:glycosyltransferase family 4 protein [Parafrankia elaeagni]
MVDEGAVALLVSFAATPAVLRLMRHLAAVDNVTDRSSHRVPTPRGGGVSVALGLFAGVLLLLLTSGHNDAPDLFPMTVAVTAFGLIGLAEDVGGIPPLRRLALHLVCGLLVSVVLLVSITLEAASTPTTAALLATAAFGLLWVAGFVNAFNFMDGVNGISVAQASVAGAALAVAGHLHGAPVLTAGGAIIAGTALGFAPFNFPHAQIFLGDVGSYTLGASLAVLALHGAVTTVPVEAVLAPFVLYLADTGCTLLRRVRQGESWYLPHRTHTYQRLTDVGWSHTRVTLTVASLLVTMSGLGLLATHGDTGVRIAADLMIVAVAAGYLNSPRLVASRRRQGSGPTSTGLGAGAGGPDKIGLPLQREASDPLVPDRELPAGAPSRRQPTQSETPTDHRRSTS